MTQADFVVLMNSCRNEQGLNPMTTTEEQSDYAEYCREEAAAKRWQ